MPVLLLVLLLAAVDGINLLQMAGDGDGDGDGDGGKDDFPRWTWGVMERCKGACC